MEMNDEDRARQLFDEYFDGLSRYVDDEYGVRSSEPSKKTIVITQAVGMMFKDVGGNIAVWNFKEEDLDDIEKLVVNGYEFTLTAKVDKFGRKVNM